MIPNNGGSPEAIRIRQYVLRIVMLVCIVIILLTSNLDNKTKSNSKISNVSKNEVQQPKVRSGEIVLSPSDTEMLISIVHKDRHEHLYASNISGTYKGTWKDWNHLNENDGISNSGNMIVQIRSYPVLNVPDVHYLYGVVKLFGIRVMKKTIFERLDILYPVQGLYVVNQGISSLITTPTRGHRIYLRMPSDPKGVNVNNSTQSVDGVSQPILAGAKQQHRMERDVEIGLPEDHEYVQWVRRLTDYSPLSTLSSETDHVNNNLMESNENGGLYLANRYISWNSNSNRDRDSVVERDLLTWSLGAETKIQLYDITPLNYLYNAVSYGMLHLKSLLFPVVSSKSSGHQLSDISIRRQMKVSEDIVGSHAVTNNNSNANKSLELPLINITTKRIVMEEYPVGNTGLRLVLLQGAPDTGGGLGELALSDAFKNFQTTNSKSLSWLQSDKCTFAFNSNVARRHASSPIHLDKSGTSFSTFAISSSSAYSSSASLPTWNQSSLGIPHQENLTMPYSPIGYVGDGYDKAPVSVRKIKTLESQMVGSSFSKSSNVACREQLLYMDVSYYKLNEFIFTRKMVSYATFASLFTLYQITLLVRLMRISSTPAALSKISILSIALQAVLDATICVCHLLLSSSFSGAIFYGLIIVSILQLILFSILEMRLILLIYQARFSNEISMGQASLRQYLSTLHARFYAALFAIMLLGEFLYTRPIIIVFLMYSFWLPQIAFCAYSGSRQSISSSVLVPLTLCRVMIPLYIWQCPSNIYLVLLEKMQLSSSGAFLLIIWLSLQVSIILLQNKYGPRFFVPARFLPLHYNYYRPVPQSLLSSGGDVSADVESGGLHECVICYVGVEPTSRNYMVTPCDHLFHEQCLTQWLDVKLECPVCRAPLPPNEI